MWGEGLSFFSIKRRFSVEQLVRALQPRSYLFLGDVIFQIQKDKTYIGDWLLRLRPYLKREPCSNFKIDERREKRQAKIKWQQKPLSPQIQLTKQTHYSVLKRLLSALVITIPSTQIQRAIPAPSSSPMMHYTPLLSPFPSKRAEYNRNAKAKNKQIKNHAPHHLSTPFPSPHTLTHLSPLSPLTPQKCQKSQENSIKPTNKARKPPPHHPLPFPPIPTTIAPTTFPNIILNTNNNTPRIHTHDLILQHLEHPQSRGVDEGAFVCCWGGWGWGHCVWVKCYAVGGEGVWNGVYGGGDEGVG